MNISTVLSWITYTATERASRGTGMKQDRGSWQGEDGQTFPLFLSEPGSHGLLGQMPAPRPGAEAWLHSLLVYQLERWPSGQDLRGQPGLGPRVNGCFHLP